MSMFLQKFVTRDIFTSSGIARIIDGYLDLTILNNDLLSFKMYFRLNRVASFSHLGATTQLIINLTGSANSVQIKAAKLFLGEALNPYPGVKYWLPQMGSAELVNSTNQYQAVPASIKRMAWRETNSVYGLQINIGAVSPAGYNADIFAMSGIIVGGEL